jgi:hypothetical protein
VDELRAKLEEAERDFAEAEKTVEVMERVESELRAEVRGIWEKAAQMVEDAEWLDIPDYTRRNIATSFRNMARLRDGGQ